MTITEAKKTKPPESKFMHLLRVVTGRQLSPDEILAAKITGRPREDLDTIPNLSNGCQENVHAYFTTGDGYVAAIQKYRHMSMPDTSHPKVLHHGYFLIGHEVRKYTAEGKLTLRTKIENVQGLEFAPVGKSPMTEVVYDPPGKLRGRKTKSTYVRSL